MKRHNLSEKTLSSLLFSKSLPQIWDITLPGVHKSVPDLGHINEIPKWFALNSGYDFAGVP